MPSSSEDYVLLAGGLAVPVEALNLALELEDREYTLVAEGDRFRVVGPRGQKPLLSEIHKAMITRWKAHLIAIVNYRPV